MEKQENKDKNKQQQESLQGLVDDFKFFINTHTNSKNITNSRLSSSLEILCALKLNVVIKPTGRKKCLICKKSLKNGELLLKFPCECFYDMHYDCFNQNPFEYFRLSAGNFMKCRTCKMKYHNSEDYYEQSTLNQTSILQSKMMKPNMEEQKAESFMCNICQEETVKFIKLDCPHKFCQKCLRQYINLKLKENQFSLQNLICPAENCKKLMTFKLIQKILMKKEFEGVDCKLLAFNPENFLKKNEKIVKCPKGNCDFFFIMRKREKNLKQYHCPKCRKDFCVNGCPELHQGYTCEQYQRLISEEGKEFMGVVQDKKIKQCEKCGVWIEKNKGCNHITCKCSHQFCYICGNKWKTCPCPQFGADYHEFSEDEDDNPMGRRLRRMMVGLGRQRTDTPIPNDFGLDRSEILEGTDYNRTPTLSDRSDFTD